MALTSTIYSFNIVLSDVDRGVYETLDLKVAQHPSETTEYMVTRVLAYCLEYTDGIEFGAGLSTPDQPAIWIRDLTGRITGWIEVGMPDADRLHRAAKLAERVAVYTHRDLRQFLLQLEGKKIFRREEIAVYPFDRRFIEEVASAIDRRNAISFSFTERHLYLDVGTKQFTTVLEHASLA